MRVGRATVPAKSRDLYEGLVGTVADPTRTIIPAKSGIQLYLGHLSSWMPVDDPVFSGDQVRYDRQKLKTFMNSEIVCCEGITG